MWTYLKAILWVKGWQGRRHYQMLNSSDLPHRRRSSKVFVFGSGYSLNDISPPEWAHFAEHDTFGFTGFIYQKWIRVDFYLIRAWVDVVNGLKRCVGLAADYAADLSKNERFAETVFLVQREFPAIFSNALIGYRLLQPQACVCLYRTAARIDGLPSRNWVQGLTHATGTLLDCINAAYLMGWKEIVLVGVDLYDSRYFWGPPDRTISINKDAEIGWATTGSVGGHWTSAHSTVRNNIVEIVGRWAHALEQDGVRLSAYNPRSLLTQVLPIYESPAARDT